MRRITWDFLSVELTRKCQLECKHCFKGKAQSYTISKETIDKFLSQTEIIGSLHFSGGEPTLALDEMRYFLECLYKYRIPLFKLQIITNGYKKSEEFVQIVKDYSDMIRLCYLDAKNDMKYYVTIGVSMDRYHIGYNPGETLEYYKKELDGYAKVLPMTDGNIPSKVGNATTLPEAIPYTNKEKLDTRIEILSKDFKPMCPQYKTYKLLHNEQVYVVCEMCLSAKGNLTLYRVCSNNEYRFEDLSSQNICNVNKVESIYDSILKYNNGKNSCLDMLRVRRIEQKKKEDDPKFKTDMFFAILNYAKIVGDETFIENIVDFLSDKHISDPEEYLQNQMDEKIVNISNITPEECLSIRNDILKFDYREEE